ncbi:MAG: hypothetical protein AMK71_02000 [Nitrospira bacterium SG8_35_4]|nr:MAG: hypothetical protein AMK71_02000 [Nitrospira bacterium SG8_35_4]
MMIHAKPVKKTVYAAVILCFFLIIPANAGDFTDRARLAVFPFLDAGSRSVRQNISSVLERELLKYDFIEVIPLKREDTDAYEMEPLSLWTGVEGSEKQGGIVWNVRHQVIQEMSAANNVEYAVFGSIMKDGRMLKIEVRVAKTGVILTKDQTPAFSTSSSGTTYDELSGKVPDMSAAIAEWLKGERVLGRAEGDIRRYLGRIVSYSDTVAAMERYVHEYPRSIPLRALLLDLHLKDRIKHKQKILDGALTIIDLYRPQADPDMRYLLSLSLDPFDIAAEAYEEKGDWSKAISIRDMALTVFPFKNIRHTDGLARDHYFQGAAYEEKGDFAKAFEQYTRAGGHVSASSEYHRKIRDGITRTENK